MSEASLLRIVGAIAVAASMVTVYLHSGDVVATCTIGTVIATLFQSKINEAAAKAINLKVDGHQDAMQKAADVAAKDIKTLNATVAAALAAKTEEDKLRAAAVKASAPATGDQPH